MHSVEPQGVFDPQCQFPCQAGVTRDSLGSYPRTIFKDLEIEIIGEGEIGDKARELIEKTSVIRSEGLYTAKRIILSESFLSDFIRANCLGNSIRDCEEVADLQQKIKEGCFTDEQMEVIGAICKSLPNDRPVGVRSSGQGDSRGTGTYTLAFVTIQLIASAAK